MKAVILAGGYGKRLRPLTENVPKPLLNVLGKPILCWQFEWLKAHGISDIIICAGHLKEKIMEDIGSGQKFGVRVGYVVEDEPLGTGGALNNTIQFLSKEEAFIVVNGDVLTNLNPIELIKILRDDVVGAIAVIPLPSPYGVVSFNNTTLRINEFKEKPRLSDYWINAGVYAFTPKVFNYLPQQGDLEKTTFPELASRGLLKAVPFNECEWISIDTHKDLEEATKIVKSLNFNH
ncbi:MAG: nucleotidyltransferase family protein [Nitrososphaerota archaeon]